MASDEHYRDYISDAADIIDEARNGRMFILVDHEDRENEGDLVIPAQMATPDAINFMAKHGRGLICLALPGERLDALGLPLMAAANQSRHETAFTVSIEARDGVTTGISAHDRARTIAVAIDAKSGPADIATPGHVFPLRAKSGGVLVRAGHTEAAVDVSRLAGLNPSGVICEIMNEDGSMARLPDLVSFAQRHNLKIGTISDLIAFRRKHDNLVESVLETTINLKHGGEWRLNIFLDAPGGAEHIALVKGDLESGGPALVRMHSLNLMDDLLALNPAKSHELHDAMEQIGAEGRGVVVILRDISATAISERMAARARNAQAKSAGAARASASPKQLKLYGLGAQILGSLGITEMILLTNSPPPKIVGLDGYGLAIVETRPIPHRES